MLMSWEHASAPQVLRTNRMAEPKLPLHPKNPERVCWGCDLYCPANALRCGNGTIRTQHPAELFGEDWLDWELQTAPKLEAKAESDSFPGEPYIAG